jgi:hypothetical protein
MKDGVGGGGGVGSGASGVCDEEKDDDGGGVGVVVGSEKDDGGDGVVFLPTVIASVSFNLFVDTIYFSLLVFQAKDLCFSGFFQLSVLSKQ